MTLEELEKLRGLVMVQKSIEQELSGELDKLGQHHIIDQLKLTAHILNEVDKLIMQAIERIARENRA